MTKRDRFLKRGFDVLLSFLGLAIFCWLIVLAAVIAYFDTRSGGFFVQQRIGLNGKTFKVFKIRSMKVFNGLSTTVTTDNDIRITKIGRFWRKSKIDELPQLWNVLTGKMSFVGPRPDVAGFADKLMGKDRVILSIRPGITGPATLKFKNEEELLANQDDPELYNKEVIWPEKVRINLAYIENYSFIKDIRYIVKTIT